MKEFFIKLILLIISVFLILCLIGIYFNQEGFSSKNSSEDSDDVDDYDYDDNDDKKLGNVVDGRKMIEDNNEYRNEIFKNIKRNIGDFDVIHDETSNYQRIEVIQFKKNSLGYDKCLLLNNEPQLCNNDEKEYHELIVHFPAYYLKKMENVLIIGGGDCMTLREVMKYPTIKHVDMLELDKQVISVTKKYFSINAYENDPRVNIMIGDATKNINKLKDNTYDLIIIDTTEDGIVNLPIDEFSFYQDCKKKLKKENSILIKNGDRSMNILSITKMFKYMEIIDLADVAIIGQYKFVFGSNTIDFKNTSIQNKHLEKLNLKKYDYKKHKNHFLI
tara:strand:+ start:705 stop:1700 length:996 start_codon:yes stop_codon:yes gene_type:complete